MEAFYSACRWFGNNRVLAYLLSGIGLGVPLGMAGVGRSIEAQTGQPNLLQIWAQSPYHGKLILAGYLNLAVVALVSVLCALSGFFGIVFAILFAAVFAPATVELLGALQNGRDSFALGGPGGWKAASSSNGPTSMLKELGKDWSPTAQTGVGLVWTWWLGLSLAQMAGTVIGLYGAFWILFLIFGAIGIATGQSGSSRRQQVEVQVLPDGARIRDGYGGIFSDTVATIEGNQIKAGVGGLLADVLATIEGNQIKEGVGGTFARVIATIEGSEIREGLGGFGARTIGTIEGNQIKSGHGGIFSEALYTIE